MTDLFILVVAATVEQSVEAGLAAAGHDLAGIHAWWLTLGLVVAWLVALQLGGTREHSVVGTGPDEYKRLINSTVVLFGSAAISSYVFALHISRVYALVMMPVGLLALVGGRLVWRRWLYRRRRDGEYSYRVLVVGDTHSIGELLADLRRAPLAGYRVIGACTADAPGGQPVTGFIDGVPLVGGLDAIAALAERHRADAVAVTSSASFGPQRVRALGWELETTAIDLILAPALTNIAGPRIHTQPVAGLPLIHVDRPAYRGAHRTLKKSFDVAAAAFLLCLLSPLLAAVALVTRIGGGGPALGRQDRVGLHGRSFGMFRFRTMVPDSGSSPNDVPAAGDALIDLASDDPRITSIGRLLRRWRVDELPQLLNVLRGEMSLVGPRPPLAEELELYGDDARLRLLVRPGMTGLRQVSGDLGPAWGERVRLDIYYVENWSITGDLLILFRTLKAVLTTGADR